MKIQQYVEKEKKDIEVIKLISDGFHLLSKERGERGKIMQGG